ncbi:tumor necrosis factor ligand superfamily member 13 isoform X3 [Astyanax mexicanus]|uniref:tumor necrosis factor ligand superfamily member 13 isoform X3 n=1 Tax=Astyanax mexicanus TaxID=7994 RepID=UPI0020CABC5F|nr:tumor necrosis factor ligand superfamily member 13 isoform X3 [Astyanax mexicanus]
MEKRYVVLVTLSCTCLVLTLLFVQWRHIRLLRLQLMDLEHTVSALRTGQEGARCLSGTCCGVWMTPAMPIGRKKREASTPKIRRKRQTEQRSILHLIPASTNSYGERDLTILTWALGRSQGAGLQVSGETISVVTEGTYFIYSQVLYKDNTWVMGHVITKRLKGAETKLMKCLKSMPSNLSEPVNTCYTAGVHYLESGSVLELSVPRQSAELILWSHATFMGIFSI